MQTIFAIFLLDELSHSFGCRSIRYQSLCPALFIVTVEPVEEEHNLLLAEMHEMTSWNETMQN